MKKGALFFLFVGAYIVNACATDVLGKKDNTEQIVPISGRVTCLGKPVEGAIISDGVDLVKTDTEGIYFINAHKVGSINSIFYFLHKAAEPFNCLEQDNLA